MAHWYSCGTQSTYKISFWYQVPVPHIQSEYGRSGTGTR